MINKKQLLGKEPTELGQKDAIHVAIVSVRAGSLIKPGQPFKMNNAGEAVPASRPKSVGVADPYRPGSIMRGEYFWGLLNMDAISSVKHDWEHPDVSFDPPASSPSMNPTLKSLADEFEVSYKELITACGEYVHNNKRTPYSGPLTKAELEDIDDLYELWSEWSEESGHEFENCGSGCCPEYEYPHPRSPFVFVEIPVVSQ